MPIANYTTSISVQKSTAEIQEMLAAAGASAPNKKCECGSGEKQKKCHPTGAPYHMNINPDAADCPVCIVKGGGSS